MQILSNIADVLGKIGDFKFTEHIDEVFPASILKQATDYVVEGRISIKLFRLINMMKRTGRIIGTINGLKVTFLDSLFMNAESKVIKEKDDFIYESVYIKIKPTEIVMGSYLFDDDDVKNVKLTYENIQWWLLDQPVKHNFDIKKDNSLLQFQGLDIHKAEDDEVSVEFFVTFETSKSKSRIEFPLSTIVQFNFGLSVHIFDAIKIIADFRNFLTFCANYYIGFKEFTFTTKSGHSFTCFMNFQENIELKNDPFVIEYSQIENDFEGIWRKWNDFSKNNSNIVTLFYEMICNRSTRINRFLNLSQSIEVYSQRYRNEEAKTYKNEIEGGKAKLRLEHRLFDVFNYANIPFDFNNNEIKVIAKAISGGRNYYTHYSNHKELSFEQISACSDYMHIILLVLVYRTIDIPNDAFKDITSRCLYQTVRERINGYIIERET